MAFFLNCLGRCPVLIVVLKSVATDGAMTEAQLILRIEADIPSDPGALEEFKFSLSPFLFHFFSLSFGHFAPVTTYS